MHIEEIILDGFKSYPTKTTIGPFHHQFNAITGLNGSGKSNVLDAICFVMGINNLNLIRVNRIDELIYKQGQAGITKGSVTIKFNNEQKPSPLQDPYRDMKTITITRQIVLGGRNRYLLNSHNAKPKDIIDFFQSLQLNINNPHFLIMQGKITKVINMKPLELLGLIEESSGTKIYEVKRTNAIKLMTKKEQKLNEIDKVLVNEIEPTLVKLKKEKEEYNKFVSNNEEIEKYEKIEIAFKYYNAKKIMETGHLQVESLKNEEKKIEKIVKELDKEINIYQKDKEKKMDEFITINEPVRLFHKEKEELELKINNLQSELKIEIREKEKRVKKRDDIKKEVISIEKKIENCEQNNQNNNKNIQNYEIVKNKINTLKEELNDKQRTLNCLMGSYANNSEYNGSFREELKNYKTNINNVDIKINNLLLSNKHLEKNIIIYKEQKKKHEHHYNTLSKEKESEEKKKIACEKELIKLNDENNNFVELDNLQNEKDKLIDDIFNLKQEIAILKNSINHIKVDYKIPSNMSPTDVIGQVYKLVQIKKDYKYAALAIHLVIGGKLPYLLVYNKEQTRRLFEYNKFVTYHKRVTVLPLNDCIIFRNIDEKHVEECRKFVGLNPKDKNSIIYFLDVMDYEPKFEKLVRYLFNGTLICPNSDMCRQITFSKNKKISLPTISLDGDKFDSSGCMSGGSNNNINLFLLNYEKYKNKKKEFNEKEIRLKNVTEELNMLEAAAIKRRHLSTELQIHIDNLNNIENRIITSVYGNACRKIEEYQSEIEKGRTELAELYIEQKKLNTSIKKLEKDIAEFEVDKDKKEEELKESVKKIKNKIKQLETEEQKTLAEVDKMRLRIDNYKKQLEKESSDLIIAEETVKEMDSKVTNIENNINNAKENIQNIEEKILEHHISSCSYENEIKQVSKQIEDLDKTRSNLLLDLKNINNNLSDIQKETKIANETVKVLYKNNIWIESHEHLFNKKCTPYDFENFSLDNIKKKIQALQNEQNKTSSNINRKAVQMFDQVQKDYKDLVTKKAQVEEDRKKIQEVIADLDLKKKESLITIYEQINGYFQAIFSTLLNNAQAKLSTIDGDLSNGVEMKIAFNNNWKDSLTELSGGQRSLLALSLILALLKVRTVPMYILDEIDAALDLNHTQNIGDMIRTQFPYSQFIIVSLKEGMFSHADVLFKMRFVDGVSVVSRHALDVRDEPKKIEDEPIKKRRVTIYEKKTDDD